MREFVSFNVPDMAAFKVQLMGWCARFSCCSVLDSNQWSTETNEIIAAAGAANEIYPENNSFEELKNFHAEKRDWLFGYLSYDLKNETEVLTSKNHDGLRFPQMHFFQPEYVFILANNSLRIGVLDNFSGAKKAADVFREIRGQQPAEQKNIGPVSLKSRITEGDYIQAIEKIKRHIRLGDIYEMNYCMEFFSENSDIDPLRVYIRLSAVSRSPFSVFYKAGTKYLMCGSPERFLKKTGNKIMSQPIKGTAKRGKNKEEDMELKKQLGQNEKEKSENVMIVDLVRNDLAKTCDQVQVEELFGVYTFKQWHQMISTVSGVLRDTNGFTDVIRGCFPMGSMTGAPKVQAMRLIEKYEKTKRGLYSGAVGYITPDGDFDLNVVIRSILYNANSGYLSLQVGSAITVNAEAKHEYEECLLKAKGMFEALNIFPGISNSNKNNSTAGNPEKSRKKNVDA